MQSILFSAVLEGIAALKRASGGLPNQLLRDVQAIHPNVTFADLPKALQDQLVESTRGAHGGYRLSRAPETITMDQVVLSLEGAVAPMSCFVDDSEEGRVLCSHLDDQGRGCATKLLWTRVQGGVIKALAQTTLAELVAFSDRTQAPVKTPVPA
jgi:Rrf2 family protein